MNQPPASSSDPCAEPSVAGLLSVAEAQARIDALVQRLRDVEQVPVRGALDRVLAEEIRSSIDVPPYTNSAMDGYALRHADLAGEGTTRLVVAGRSMAGQPYSGEVSAGQCVRIMTGAMLPTGCDTVVMQEQVERDGDNAVFQAGHSHGQNVRHTGEDLASGDIVLAPGRHITAADLGVLASLGIAEVRVYRRLRVAFFSTGDELVSLGQVLGEGQIYDSNRYTLYGMLRRMHADVIDMGVIPDDRDAVREAFERASAMADVVCTSGGVSVGEADFVKETLELLGEVDFWKIAMKPGKPLAFGTVGQALFFGLPGNPVSVMATFYQFVRPALLKMQGELQQQSLRLRVPCVGGMRKHPGRTEFQRGILETAQDGSLQVVSSGRQGSHVLSSMSRANCFIILPAECAGVADGESVEVQPFAGLV